MLRHLATTKELFMLLKLGGFIVVNKPNNHFFEYIARLNKTGSVSVIINHLKINITNTFLW